MRRNAALIVALALMSASCGGYGKGGFKDPVVTFKNVKVGGIGLTGGTLDIVLSVYNPNGYRLDASRLTYQLLVDSLPIGNGALDKHFVVNSNDSTDVDLPLHFKWSGVNAASREILNSGSVPYRVLGRSHRGIGSGRLHDSIRSHGELQLVFRYFALTAHRHRKRHLKKLHRSPSARGTRHSGWRADQVRARTTPVGRASRRACRARGHGRSDRCRRSDADARPPAPRHLPRQGQDRRAARSRSRRSRRPSSSSTTSSRRRRDATWRPR